MEEKKRKRELLPQQKRFIEVSEKNRFKRGSERVREIAKKQALFPERKEESEKH